MGERTGHFVRCGAVGRMPGMEVCAWGEGEGCAWSVWGVWVCVGWEGSQGYRGVHREGSGYGVSSACVADM